MLRTYMYASGQRQIKNFIQSNEHRYEILKPEYLKSMISEKVIFWIQSQMPDPKTYKQHFESKHPKAALPPELASA